ncbi:MAG: DUF1549 domain-containing protein, partial [Verrucomicrobiae bacterium]|nr:DUF1549 domain-containing protein [Verrucomicrobiae bacterium]
MDFRTDLRFTSRCAWAFAALAAGWSVICFGGDSSEADKWKAELAERARWWSLQPPHAVSPPSVKDPAWQAEPVDRFILSELTKASLAPAPPADAATLARRLSFVLTGLPPEPATVTRFVDAYAGDPETALRDQVDEWLASPHFGERFARHWMDVVRYTDTYGYEWDNPVKGSWEYRDYLIRAFNADIGFDQLIREQIAGDLLPEPRIDEAAGFNESLIGPTFYHLGEHRHGTSIEFNGVHQEMVNNKIDAFSKAFLAVTVACARCHDHKLDAISQADYYALAGVFMTPRWTSRVIDAPGKQAAAIGQLRNLRERIQETMAAAWPSTAAGKLRPDTLQAWAVQHRESLQSTTHGQGTYPMAKWLDVPDAGAATRWKELAAEWRNARAERQKSNAETFTVVTDFATPGFPTGWVTEGDGIEQGWVADGTLLVRLEGETLIDSFLPRGYHTHALSPKFPGALRLPAEDQIPGAFVSLQLQGAEWAGRLVAPQNAFQSEGVTFFDPEAKANWLATPDSPLKNGVSRVLVEFATASLNPNFPPRTGLARAGKTKLPDEDFGFDKRSWFSLTGIVSHNQPGAPADPMDAYVRLFEEESLPATAEEGWGRMAMWLRATVERWAAGKSEPGDAGLLNWMLAEGWLPNRMEDLPEASEWATRYREVESTLTFPRTANTMDEREIDPIDYRLNVRGNVDEEGPAIPRRFLEVFDHQQ